MIDTLTVSDARNETAARFHLGSRSAEPDLSALAAVFVAESSAPRREATADRCRAWGFRPRAFVTGQALLESVGDDVVGCAVVNVELSDMSGLDVLAELARRRVPLPVIMTAVQAEVSIAVSAMKRGVIDFIEAHSLEQQLAPAVRQALAVNAEVRKSWAQDRHVERRVGALSAEEMELVRLIVSGKPNKIISSELDISLRTFHTRRNEIFIKAAVASREELVLLYAQYERLQARRRHQQLFSHGSGAHLTVC